MTEELPKSPDDAGSGTGDLAVIGEQEQEVSFKLVQSVYNELTGRTEELSAGHDRAFMLVREDLFQLNAKVLQVCEQYNVKSTTCTVTVFYMDDRKEAYSSFDRFKLADATSLKPTESVVLKYEILILLPKTLRVQTYTVTVRVASMIALHQKMRTKLPRGASGAVLQFMTARNAMVTVQYVDYLVARNLRDTVEEWIRGLPLADPGGRLRFCRERSHLIRIFIKYALFLGGAKLTWTLVPRFVPLDANLQQLAFFGLIAAFCLFLAYRLGIHLGVTVEEALDSTTDLSYIKLNRGDEQAIESAIAQRRADARKAVVGTALALVVGVVANLIASWLTSAP